MFSPNIKIPSQLMLSIRLSVLSIILMCATSAALGCTGPKPVIRLHDFGTDSSHLSNAIFEFMIENGYGYPVEIVIETSPEMQQNLAKGEIDLTLEGWQQNAIDWYERETRAGAVVNMGSIYEGGPQFFVIPRWVADEHDIETIFDMNDHWHLFRDPEDPSKGVFFNCIIGWECSRINRVKLAAYGLTSFYNVKSPGSAEALKAALARSHEIRQPVFGYYWAPSDLIGAYEWHVLEEPVYNSECWALVAEAADGDGSEPLHRACAYENRPIDKLASSELLRKAPDVAEVVRKMVVGLGPMNESLAWANQNAVKDWNVAAVHYLRVHSEDWETWVTPEAKAKIKLALQENPG